MQKLVGFGYICIRDREENVNTVVYRRFIGDVWCLGKSLKSIDYYATIPMDGLMWSNLKDQKFHFASFELFQVSGTT